MIEASHLSKGFVVNRRKSGLKQAAKSLFQRERTFIQALDDVSFTIPDGQVVGYIGPNGAGKSTTVKILSGILTPDSGSCLINGRTPLETAAGTCGGNRRGVRPALPALVGCPGGGFLRPAAGYLPGPGKPVPEKRGGTDPAVAAGSPAAHTRPVSCLWDSGCGVKSRLPLLHDPKVLFLDEPTIGLDAVSKLAVRDFIRDINRERGVTVILTTHDMQDIEALAQRILLIGKGRLLLDGTLEQLRQQYGRGSVTVSYSDGKPDSLSGLDITEQEPGRLTVATDGTREDTARVIAQLTGALTITDISVKGPDPEELVVSLYREYQV